MPLRTSVASSSLIGKASYGNLYGFSVVSTTAGYVLVFDSTTVPADGTVTPVYCYSVAANTTTGASWGSLPASFSNGIVLVYSTTGCFTKTASATAFFSMQVQ